MPRYKNITQQVLVVPNVGTFAPGEVTQELETPIESLYFIEVTEEAPASKDAESEE